MLACNRGIRCARQSNTLGAAVSGACSLCFPARVIDCLVNLLCPLHPAPYGPVHLPPQHPISALGTRFQLQPLKMCFDDGTTYRSRTYEACSDSYHDEVVLAPRPVRRYGPRRTYYPSSYYTRPPCGRLLNSGYYGGRYGSRNVVPGGYGYGGGNYLAGGRVPMPSNSAMVSTVPRFPLSSDRSFAPASTASPRHWLRAGLSKPLGPLTR